MIVFLIFVAVVTVTHDVVHGSLGLSPRQTEWALFLFGAILLESGHAYRTTHLQHHRVFPGPDDPEGDPARMSFWAAVLFGPLFLPRLWWWAYRRSRARRGSARLAACWKRVWAFWCRSSGVLLLPWTPVVLVYAVLALIGSWVYPLLTVHLPHHDYGDNAADADGFASRPDHPRAVPGVDLSPGAPPLPGVPSHHLPELGRRLEPFFAERGVKLRRVP